MRIKFRAPQLFVYSPRGCKIRNLTYMSISHNIVRLEQQGKLVRYVPKRTARHSKRRLFMAVRMNDSLCDPNSPVNLLVGRGEIEAALTLWTVGDRIYNNAKRQPGFLKRLESPPPEVWAIRITNPNPQLRVFGRFAEPDTFVAMDIYTRQYLGRKKSKAWKNACAQCVFDWRELFPQYEPFIGRRVSDYVTENCDDFALAK